MKRRGQFIKKFLYNNLSFKNYLLLLSKVYFFSFDLGLLKSNKLYEYPYFLRKILKKDETIIDIGANLGYLTKLFSKLVGGRGVVYAIEPVKPILEVLRINTKSCKNVVIYPYALGDENKKITMANTSKRGTGFVASGSNYIPEKEFASDDNDLHFEVDMKKGSELFANLDRLDFIKCDIEGFETTVMPELEPIVTKFKPTMLIESRKEKRKFLLDYYSKLSYNAYVLHDGKLMPTDENEYWDILFIHQSNLQQFAKYFA